MTGYIVTTIKHSAIERQRRDASCARLVERLIADPSQTQSYTSFDACYEVTERTETPAEVLSALEQLPTIYKTTVTLRIYVGLSERDVARELFIAQKTVRTRVNRGLQMLRTHLADVA